MKTNEETPCPEIGIHIGITASLRIISVNGINGEAPYQYSLNGTTWQSSDQFSNLSPGDYEIWAKDQNNCTGTRTVNLPPPDGNTCPAIIMDMSTTPLSGTISAEGRNGQAPYRYSLDNKNYQESGIFTGLKPGNYTVWCLDANGCPCTRNIYLAMAEE